MLNTVLQMINEDATHVAVATDHVIESFRNQLWPGYKTGDGIEPALRAQFQPLEEALAAMGVLVWPTTDFEADDALASAAAIATADTHVQKVCIWTPDKDLAQCVRADRELALLFKKLATLRTDAPVMANVDELRWHGPTDTFAECCARMDATTLPARAQKAFAAMSK